MATVRALLNHAQPIPGFVDERIDFDPKGSGRLDVGLRAHEQRRACCSQCRRPCPGYDRLPARRWRQVPLWNIVCWYYCAPRRVQCPEHGIVVEHLPWSEGKRPWTIGMMAFLSMWARRLSWRVSPDGSKPATEGRKSDFKTSQAGSKVAGFDPSGDT